MKMKLSIAAVAVLTLTAQAMQSPLRFPHNEQEALNRAIAMSLRDQYNAVPQRPVQIQQQDDDLQRALELSAQQYEREVASREAWVAQQEKEELEEAQRLSIKKLNEELITAIKNRATLTDIQEFLDQGADIEACDSQGLTSLMWAAKLGFLDVVNHLIKAGAYIEARDQYGQTALNHAAAKGHTGCLIALLDHGANIEVVSNTKETLLHTASRHGRIECMKVLIAYGANIDAQDEEGNTPLARSVMNNKNNAAELLIYSDATVFLPDYRGVYLFDKAMIGRSINLPLRMLLAKGVIFNILSNIWPTLCPSEQDMNTRYARLKTGLLCINRVSDSPIPKDVRRLILCSDSGLSMDLEVVLYYRLYKGDALTNFQLNLLKQRISEDLMNAIHNGIMNDVMIAFVRAGFEPECISFFGFSLESDFGQAIRTKIIGGLNALQHKALTNNETKENK